MIQIANAPCSWGILEFGLEGQTTDYAQVLDEMRETGYAGTELGDWGFMPTNPVQLKRELAARGLTLLGAFVPVNLSDRTAHAAGEETALRIARLLADVAETGPFIILADDNGKNPIRTQNAGRIRPEHGLSDEGWQTFAEGAERIARVIYAQTGLRTLFHHHCAGYVETPEEVEQLLALTDPGVLGLCFDTGHYRFGGGDPLDGLRRHADRIRHVHFKDCHPEVARRARAEGWDYFRAVREGIFCELGKGEVPFAAIKAELERLGYDGWIVVEQDVLPGMGTPKDSARRNREFLKSIGL
ncbi:MAG: TIM barrel protein [Anaerolineales bacterium]|nr:TIM barrel protein [Anaerolineales bacterium]